MNRKLLLTATLLISVWSNALALPFGDEEKSCGYAEADQLFRDIAPTTEQLKMDMRYYSLNLDLDIATTSMACDFQAVLTVLDSTLETLELDYSTDNPGVGNITVNTVLVDGDTSAFTHFNDLLQIPLTTAVDTGQTITVRILAEAGPAGNHDDQGFDWDYEFSQRAIWTNSQPYDARDWWPCVDYPRDKPDSVDIVVTLADYMTVASNGRLVSNTDNNDGTRTWHWHEGHPIATYLVSLSIYEFYTWGDIYVDANQDTLPIQFYTYTPPEAPNPSYLTTNYRLLPDIIALYDSLFGPYPFMDEKYGHAEWGKSFGMEHQTLTSMGNPTERRVAHELAHMWYGDMITCNSYHHIWLNEGFARYAEALWWGQHYGPAGYREKMVAFEYYGGGTIYVEDPETESIFNMDLSYNKPAWVLHMLRHMVGDETFFNILRSYAADPRFKYKTATTEQFQEVCEELSGLDLDNYFQQWIYGQGFPHYRAYRIQTGENLLVQTIQSGLTFDMPVDIRITTTGSVMDTVLQLNEQFMTFHFQIPSGETVTNLVLDPGGWILKSTDYVVGLADEAQLRPTAFGLEQNYPNPFNPATTIPYHLDSAGSVQLLITDLQGRVVQELLHEHQTAGSYQLTWNGLNTDGQPVAAGIYFCRLISGQHTALQKLVLVK